MDVYEYNEFYFPPDIELVTHIMSDYDTNIHAHEYVEIFYILSGTITHVANGTHSKLSTGDMVFLRPYAKDRHHFIRNYGSCTHRDIMISPELFKNACEYMDKSLYNNVINADHPVTVKLSSTNIHTIESMMQALTGSANSTLTQRKLMIRSCMTYLLSFLGNSSLDTTLVPACLTTLLELLSKPEFVKGGIKMMLEKTNYNQIYLCRVFKEHMNMTMTEYLNTIRLNYADFYLRNTNMPIITICNEVGFSSVSYFEKLFKKQYNTTPLKYRNLLSK